jgi:hypothetical protein
MGAKATRDVAVQLKRIHRRLEHWRQTRHGRVRIPEALWGLAVEAVSTYGLNRTARALGLDYYSLKKRVVAASCVTERQVTRRGSKVPAAARFVELAPLAGVVEPVPPASGGLPECLLEFENVGGAKLRVHLKGVAVPDLAALSRSFWSADA